jgi:NhaA family Na+:H+ antiporter
MRSLHGWITTRPHVFHPSRIIEAAQAFVAVEASSGIVLMAAAVLGMLWINSPLGDSYNDLWHSQVVFKTGVFAIQEDLRHLINDGLMTLFFFLVGLEIKRELVHGEMSQLRRAMLPAIAALGGMAGPALIYAAFNAGGDGASGWGVPMATDIAFSLGVHYWGPGFLSAPRSLLALAIADDIGAVLVIVVFYTSELDFGALAVALALLAIVVALNRTGVREINVYLALGVALWIATYESGAHATLAGVALGLITPARSLYEPSDYPRTARAAGWFQHALTTGDGDVQQGLLADRGPEQEHRGAAGQLERGCTLGELCRRPYICRPTRVDLGGGVAGDGVERRGAGCGRRAHPG